MDLQRRCSMLNGTSVLQRLLQAHVYRQKMHKAVSIINNNNNNKHTVDMHLYTFYILHFTCMYMMKESKGYTMRKRVFNEAIHCTVDIFIHEKDAASLVAIVSG